MPGSNGRRIPLINWNANSPGNERKEKKKRKITAHSHSSLIILLV